MAASKAQGSYFGLFLVGVTVLCAGIAYLGGATGKVLLVAGAVILLVSLAGFLKIKPLEGETPLLSSPEATKWLGGAVALLGWLVTLGGLRVVGGNGGRIVVALLGIGVSGFGILYVLPAVFAKKAFWKVAGSTPGRSGLAAAPGMGTLEPELTAAPAPRRVAK